MKNRLELNELDKALEIGAINNWEYGFYEGNMNVHKDQLSNKQNKIMKRIEKQFKDFGNITSKYRFAFGKHKGQTVCEVPLGYLQYCCANIPAFKNMDAEKFFDEHSTYDPNDEPESINTNDYNKNKMSNDANTLDMLDEIPF